MHAKELLRELSISVTAKLSYDAVARNKIPITSKQRLPIESRFQWKIWIKMIRSQPLAIEEG